MPKRLTTEEFVVRAKTIHGNRYDYSRVKYINCRTPIELICRQHGVFIQKPDHHISGCGCPKCSFDKERKPICGVGINDYAGYTATKQQHIRSYSIWKGIIRRCFDEKFKKNHPCYTDCTVCDEWLYYSNFKKWYDEYYIGGTEIDKDILSIRGVKHYSPQTCCFIPKSLNNALVDIRTSKGFYKNGSKYKYIVMIRHNEREHDRYIGSFKTSEEAIAIYQQIKKQYVNELAEKYFKEGKINERVYNALLKFEVTD